MLSQQLEVLREAIAVLERGAPLRPDAAARLAMYKKNEERLSGEVRMLDHALVRGEWLRTSNGENGENGESDLASDLLDRLATADVPREAKS